MRSFTSLPAAVAASLLIAVSGLVGTAEAEEAAGEEGMKPLVLVAGATGKTGALVVAQLQAKGYPVRAFVRDAAKAAERLGPEVEAVVGDLKDRASIAAALDGIGGIAPIIPSPPPSRALLAVCPQLGAKLSRSPEPLLRALNCRRAMPPYSAYSSAE